MRQPAITLLTLAALACGTPAAAQTRLVLLGTGTPNADPDRSGPASAVVVNGTVYLVDAGPGLVRRAEAARRAGVAELAQPNLKTVFLTHLHSDHTLGLADLLFTPWVLERTAALRVYGPAGTRALMEHLAAAYAEDVRVRLDGWQPQNRTGQHAEAHEFTSGVVYRDSNVTVTAFRVPHGSWPEAYGFRFQTRDRVIVFSGDTGPADSLIAAVCNGCDILVHEVYSDSGFTTRDADWKRYHSYFHTSASELARIATRARPGILVLHHQLLWGASVERLITEIRQGYPGRVVSGRDLDIF